MKRGGRVELRLGWQSDFVLLFPIFWKDIRGWPRQPFCLLPWPE